MFPKSDDDFPIIPFIPFIPNVPNAPYGVSGCGQMVHNSSMKMFPEPDIDDDDDDFDEEAEAKDRYPFLFDEDDKHDHRTLKPIVNNDPSSSENPPYSSNSAGKTNYHYLHELNEDLLPNLDFFRFDNFFAARPAYGFFLDKDRPQPLPPRLFGNFWFEGEIAVLFADTGAGKSLLAMQIAQSVASGFTLAPFGIDTSPQRVVYFDFELSQEQFDRRYSNDDPACPAKFPFHRNLIRNSPHPNAERSDEYKDETQFITSSIVEFIEFSKARVVIVDNITWMNNSAQIGNSAPRIMKALSRLKRKLGISILVLAHTPKRYFRAPLTVNDLQGSKMIANFADSIFALGSSRKGKDVRYLKSIKQRSTAADADNRTATLRLEKDVCMLGFKFEEHSDERDHIGWMRSGLEPERMMLTEKVLELEKQGLSQRKIGVALGVSVATVNRCLKAINE